MKIATETVMGEGDSKVHSVFSYECDRCQGDKVHPIMDANHATLFSTRDTLLRLQPVMC
jgi:hypothetical protein